MDKCIKVELPTGHVLLDDLKAATQKSRQYAYEFTGGEDYKFNECGYDGWVVMWVGGHCWLFKVIAQYGDEFPV